MKTKILLLSLLFSGAAFLTSAQNNTSHQKRSEKREFRQARIDSARVARTVFIAEKAGLTSAEQSKFLPLYQEYLTKLRELRQTSRRTMRMDKDSLNYTQALNEAANVRTREAELFKEYTAKFTQIIPAEKVWKVLQSERQFKHKAMKRGEKNSPHKFRDKTRMNCQHPQNSTK